MASQTPGGRSQGAIDVFHFLGGPPAPGAQGCKLRVKGSLKVDKPKVQRSSQAGTCVSMSSHCHVEEPTLEGAPGCSDSWLGSPFVALPAGRQHHSGPLSALQPRGPGRLARAAQREAEPARGPQRSAPAHLSVTKPPSPRSHTRMPTQPRLSLVPHDRDVHETEKWHRACCGPGPSARIGEGCVTGSRFQGPLPWAGPRTLRVYRTSIRLVYSAGFSFWR